MFDEAWMGPCLENEKTGIPCIMASYPNELFEQLLLIFPELVECSAMVSIKRHLATEIFFYKNPMVADRVEVDAP